MNDVHYPSLLPPGTGPAGACPRCGRGKPSDGFLPVAGKCRSRGLSCEFADGGDGAAWFVMPVVCAAGVGSIPGVEAGYSPPHWVHALSAVAVLIILPVLLLRPVKGLRIKRQRKTGASEGRLPK